MGSIVGGDVDGLEHLQIAVARAFQKRRRELAEVSLPGASASRSAEAPACSAPRLHHPRSGARGLMAGRPEGIQQGRRTASQMAGPDNRDRGAPSVPRAGSRAALASAPPAPKPEREAPREEFQPFPLRRAVPLRSLTSLDLPPTLPRASSGGADRAALKQMRKLRSERLISRGEVQAQGSDCDGYLWNLCC
ncbi:uncharacterized protein ACBT57_018787 [Dama dama]